MYAYREKSFKTRGKRFEGYEVRDGAGNTGKDGKIIRYMLLVWYNDR